jgi:hypothetical protein
MVLMIASAVRGVGVYTVGPVYSYSESAIVRAKSSTGITE